MTDLHSELADAAIVHERAARAEAYRHRRAHGIKPVPDLEAMPLPGEYSETAGLLARAAQALTE